MSKNKQNWRSLPDTGNSHKFKNYVVQKTLIHKTQWHSINSYAFIIEDLSNLIEKTLNRVLVYEKSIDY